METWWDSEYGWELVSIQRIYVQLGVCLPWNIVLLFDSHQKYICFYFVCCEIKHHSVTLLLFNQWQSISCIFLSFFAISRSVHVSKVEMCNARRHWPFPVQWSTRQVLPSDNLANKQKQIGKENTTDIISQIWKNCTRKWSGHRLKGFIKPC